MDMDNRVVKIWWCGWVRAGWKAIKGKKEGDMCDTVNNKCID